MHIDISEFLSNKDEVIFKESSFVDKDEIEAGINLQENPSFDLIISKVDGDLYLDLDIFFNYITKCDRCLTTVDVEDQVKYKSQISSAPVDFGTEIEDNQIDYVFMKDGKIDLSELIRQLIILSIPLKTVCQETCEGLCSGCGVNLNEEECQCQEQLGDIRFAVLKNLELD